MIIAEIDVEISNLQKEISQLEKKVSILKSAKKLFADFDFDYRIIDRTNYFNYTSVIWNNASLWGDQEKPDYISYAKNDATGELTDEVSSKYWYTKDGVYRQSDHWGRVGTCQWDLNPRQVLITDDRRLRCGYCAWGKFRDLVPMLLLEYLTEDTNSERLLDFILDIYPELGSFIRMQTANQ